MASKFADILPKLSELPVQDKSYQDKINVFKGTILSDPEFVPTPSNLAKQFSSLRAEKDKIEDDLYQINLELEAYTQMLVDTQEAKDKEWGAYGGTSTTLRLITGDKIEVRKEPYATVEDKDACRKWAVDNGLERLLALPWQTINSLTKEKLLAGEAEPDGVKTFVKTKIVFTKMKKGTE